MIVIVTGLIRSGTSLVARQLHELGVPMGTTMRFPFPEKGGQLEYEDVEFTDKCFATLNGQSDVGVLHSFFQSYVHKRREQCYDMWRMKEPLVWGMKSPFALPYVDLFKRMANEPVKVILTTRDIESTYKSLERQIGKSDVLPLARSLQDKLRTYTVDADLTIDITESWMSPETVADKLKELLWES